MTPKHHVNSCSVCRGDKARADERSDDLDRRAALERISTLVVDPNATHSFTYSNLCEAVGTAREALKNEKLIGYVDTRGYLRCVHCIADGMGKYEDDSAVCERSSPHNVEPCECCGMRLNDPNIEAGPSCSK